MLFLGLDEAGYGPNLGPLVIGATAWRGPDELQEGDWYAALGPLVAACPADGRVSIADSKQLYQAGGTLAQLECGVLAALMLLDRAPRHWREIWSAVACSVPVKDGPDSLNACPWEAPADVPLPRDVNAEALLKTMELWAHACRRAGDYFATPVEERRKLRRRKYAQGDSTAAAIELLDLRARIIYPREFNSLVDRLESKGAVLSQCTLELAASVIAAIAERFPDEPICVLCDKHGGRDRYAAVLQHIFPDAWIEPLRESRAESRYRFRLGERPVHFRFQAKGETFLPAALASMTAKYLRELAMLAFNGFWKERLPELKPTAGYPDDAKRFHSDIQSAFTKLNLPLDYLWRKR